MIQIANRNDDLPNFIPLITKEELRLELQTKVADIEFTKVDGTLRKMKCTLIEALLPEPVSVVEENAKVKRLPNPNVLVVWDLENDVWRSIRCGDASIKSILYHAD
jgi:hypothetical protein